MARAGLWVAAVAVLALAGCDKADSSGKDTLATVGGERITKAQVDVELKATEEAQPNDPAVRKAALDRMINRKLLAQAAREEKLDRTPENAILRAAAAEAWEAGLELRKITDSVEQPTAEDVAAFVQAHPEMFAQRTGYLIDQLHVDAKPDAAMVAALQPVKSLEEAERVLQARKAPFRRSVEQLDSLRADPRITDALRKLAPGEPLVMQEPTGFSVSSVRKTLVQPVVGPQATAVATQMVLAQRRAKAMNDRIAALKAEKVKTPKTK
jgi:peptidyl-prolyl cis-trans isomerase C